jgi:hypothetical protein
LGDRAAAKGSPHVDEFAGSPAKIEGDGSVVG